MNVPLVWGHNSETKAKNMWFSTMTTSIQRYVIFMCMKLLLQETAWQMKKERLAYKLVDKKLILTHKILIPWLEIFRGFLLSNRIHFFFNFKCIAGVIRCLLYTSPPTCITSCLSSSRTLWGRPSKMQARRQSHTNQSKVNNHSSFHSFLSHMSFSERMFNRPDFP